jgi:urease accessory protein
MSAATSLSEREPGTQTPRAIAVHGVGRVVYGVDETGTTRLQDLYQSDPVRVLFPTPPRDEIQSATFVTTSGGLVGGDVLELTAQVVGDAAALFYPQAAEKIYRSTGRESRIDVALTVGAGSWLEWLPQETILFDGARLIRRTAADVEPGGRLLAGDMVVLGRTAMGETIHGGVLRDEWTVRRDGRLVWADALCLEGAIAETVAHPAGLAGATALATAVYMADDAAANLTTARDLLAGAPEAVRVGASVVNDLLVIRFLANDAAPLRHFFGEFWADFRHAVAGLPAALPRLWQI